MVDERFKAQVDAYVDEVWEDVVASIDELVSIESVEDLSTSAPGAPWGAGPAEALKKALEIASRLGLDAHTCDGYLGYADVPGERETQVATIAHVDIVPVGKGWTVDPLRVTRKEGYLLGRGVLDDKGPFVLSLYAAHFFARCAAEGERPRYTLRCLAGSCEETTMDDVAWYLDHYDAPAFLFTPDADFPLICGEKGIFHGLFTSGPRAEGIVVELDGGTVANAVPGEATALVRADAAELPAAERIEVVAEGDGLARVTARGKGGHASIPEGTVNAIGLLVDYLLAHGLCSAEERSFLELEQALCSASDGSTLGIAAADATFGPLTCVGGVVRTVNGRFTQTVDSRYPTSITGEAIASALSELGAQHGCTFAVNTDKKPFYVEPTSPEIRALLDTYNEYTGRSAEAFAIGGGTYARNFPNACAFGPHDPAFPDPAWVGMEHGPDEGVSEEALRRALKIYIVSIARLMELELGA